MSLYQQKPFANYQFVSIVVQSLQQRYYFPDLPNLREVLTNSMSFYTALNISVDNNNQPLVTGALDLNMYLTMYTGGRYNIKQLDVNYFIDLNTSGLQSNQNGQINLAGKEYVFSKSYVEFYSGAPASGATVINTPPFVFAFGVYYDNKKTA